MAVLSSLLLTSTYTLGLLIDDPSLPDIAVREQVSQHFLTAVGGLLLAMLVHAIVLTYFMGTGRWMDETRQIYQLPEKWQAESHAIKYRVLPWMAAAIVMLILAGAFGAIADPGSSAGTNGWETLSAETVHFLISSIALALNFVIYIIEYQAIHRNSQLVEEVLNEVHRIRREKGLPV